MPIVFDSSRMPGDRIGRGAKSKSYTSLDRGAAPAGVDPAQWSANPYAQFDYRHTWWQKLWEGLGFRSKFDEYRDSMALNAAEYDAQLAEKAHNEAYDNPLAQAQRQRAAGLNPDLNGNVDSGSASPMEPDPNAPISPGYNDPIPIVQGFADTIMSAFTGAIGLAKDAFSLFVLKNDVDAGRIGNSASIVDFAMKNAIRFIPDSYPEGDPEWINRAVSQAMDSSAGFMSKKQAKMYERALKAFYNSAPTQADQWKAWNESQTGKFDYFKRTSSEFFQDGTDEVLRIITDNLMKVQDKIFKQGLNLDSLKQQKESQYLQSVDPSLQGQVENVTNQRNIESGQIDYYLNEALGSIIEDLHDRSESGKKGHGFAQVALLVFSVLRMMNFSKTSGVQSGKPVNTTSFGF